MENTQQSTAFERQRNMAKLYRKMESRLKSTARHYTRKYSRTKVLPEDVEAEARLAFVRACENYRPNFGNNNGEENTQGARIETLATAYANTAANDFLRKQARLNNRFLVESDVVVSGPTEESDNLDALSFLMCGLEQPIDVYEWDLRQKDIDRCLESGLTSDELLFLRQLEQGVSAREQIREGIAKKHKTSPMLKNIKALVSKELGLC
jgi:DNA-directed RNA polymerase specialized sigma24 family protein